MQAVTHEEAANAADTLNDLVADFVAGVMVWRDYHARHRQGTFNLQQMAAVQKMCLSHIVLSLCKYAEFYERFKRVIPADHIEVCKGLYKTIEQKGMVEFRNKVVGHIWDKEQGRPLLLSEIMQRVETITGPDSDAFLRWINDPADNVYPQTVVSVVETVRDAIMASYGLTPEDIINR